MHYEIVIALLLAALPTADAGESGLLDTTRDR